MFLETIKAKLKKRKLFFSASRKKEFFFKFKAIGSMLSI